MSYILYLRDDCHDCDLVRQWLDEQGVDYRTDDIDRPVTAVPFRLFASPALCLDGDLIGYGVDIIARLSAQRSGTA